MHVTMRDVADQANVSVATVSHVLNNTRFVAEETRQRVLNVIAETGYRPDVAARSFKTGKKKLIGIIVPDIANMIWAMVIEAVEEILSERDYRLVICNTKETEEREIEYVRTLSSGLVDGLILASTLHDYNEIAAELPPGFPVVFVDRMPQNCPHDMILPQDMPAIYSGMERLITEGGHRRIGFITGLMRISTSVDRLTAYRNAMRDYGLPVEEGFIQQGNSMAKSAVILVQTLLQQNCTAIVVSNNIMADDVLFFLRDRGIRLGEDVSILGQGVEGQSDYTLRKLDLFIQPTAELGHAAGRQILDRLEHPDAPIRHTILNSVFVRGSSR